MTATKTIEIDADAYQRLERVRRGSESFSDTLKRVIWDPALLEVALQRAEIHPLSDEAVDVIEQVVAARGKPARRTRRTG